MARGAADAEAAERLAALVKSATAEMRERLDAEIARLEDLRRTNALVTHEEIAALEAQRQELESAIGRAHVRLDTVRLIWRRPG